MIKLRLTWLYKDTKKLYIYIYITKRVSSEDTSSLSLSLLPTQCGAAWAGRCWNESKIDLNNRRNTTESMCGKWDINNPFPKCISPFFILKTQYGFWNRIKAGFKISFIPWYDSNTAQYLILIIGCVFDQHNLTPATPFWFCRGTAVWDYTFLLILNINPIFIKKAPGLHSSSMALYLFEFSS